MKVNRSFRCKYKIISSHSTYRHACDMILQETWSSTLELHKKHEVSAVVLVVFAEDLNNECIEI